MVYYYTSKNVKFLRSLILDYQTLNDVSPREYMKTYFESSPLDIDDSKISWTIESFLGIHKHNRFIKEVLTRLAQVLSIENKDYFTIIFHAIIFQITPKDMTSLYKSMFNLSKVLLESFLKILSNNENLPLISQIAEVEYDKTFVTDNIKIPLLTWYPFICEMHQTYKEYMNKIISHKLKKPTIPINMRVLNRSGKSKIKDITQNVDKRVDENFDNSLDLIPDKGKSKVKGTNQNVDKKVDENFNNRLDLMPDKRSKMLTNSKINKNLNRIREKNKIKALNLYTAVKSNNPSYAQKKNINNDNVVEERDIQVKHKRIIKPLQIQNTLTQIKLTATSIKRMSKKIKDSEQEEVKWLQDIVTGASDGFQIEKLISIDRQEKERQRMSDIERKHLMGQISYEEAVIAKKKQLRENKRKYEEFLEEKKLWEKEIEKWKLKEMERNRTSIEKCSLIELEVANSKNNVTLKKKEAAEKIRQDRKKLRQIELQHKQAELERKADMIKEIKILSMIAKKSRLPRIIDLTESSGFGLLCEMSIAELQERLVSMKICFKEELEEKRNKINTSNFERKQELVETKKYIENYISERENLRKETKAKNETEMPLTNEIGQLKKMLLDRRNERIMLTK